MKASTTGMRGRTPPPSTAGPADDRAPAAPTEATARGPELAAGTAAAAAATSGTAAPETLEGWYALHQIWRIDRASVRQLSAADRREIGARALQALMESTTPPGGTGDGAHAGWSAVAELTGSTADLMVVHFRPTLDAIGEAQRRLATERLFDRLEPDTSFLSVTEAGLYHISAAVAAAREAAGGVVGDAEYRSALAQRAAAERATPLVQRRLYPSLPTDMPYICFYPMSKRRSVGQNWYALSLAERSRLMQAHGMTGRRYAGRVQQVITGAIGLDAWEWGVTLFARDPLDFKRLVTDMRFDEVSAQYAEFGDFYVGRVVTPARWVERVLGADWSRSGEES